LRLAWGRPRGKRRGEVLEHNATIEAAAGHRLAADQHLALRRLEESRDDVEERRLAAAASPHHAQELGLRHRDGDVAERRHCSLGRLVLEREMAQLDEAHRSYWGARHGPQTPSARPRPGGAVARLGLTSGHLT